jgi:hypothetical protein
MPYQNFGVGIWVWYVVGVLFGCVVGESEAEEKTFTLILPYPPALIHTHTLK